MEIESTHEGQPIYNFRRITFTIILTMITAYLLSVFGYIPVNPTYAIVMGSFIGVLYICYEICVGRQIIKHWESLQDSDKGADLI